VEGCQTNKNQAAFNRIRRLWRKYAGQVYIKTIDIRRRAGSEKVSPNTRKVPQRKKKDKQILVLIK
jgi:hypothetical protein